MDVLTTYLTPTSGGADGNNGEIGLKTMRKGSKTAEKRSKTGTGRLEVCLIRRDQKIETPPREPLWSLSAFSDDNVNFSTHSCET